MKSLFFRSDVEPVPSLFSVIESVTRIGGVKNTFKRGKYFPGRYSKNIIGWSIW